MSPVRSSGRKKFLFLGLLLAGGAAWFLVGPGASDTASAGTSGPPRGKSKPNEQSGYELKQRSYASGLKSQVGITGRQSGRAVSVLVLKNGKPAPGELVEFRIVGQPDKAKGAKLSAIRVKTDAKGRATTQFTIGDREGDYLVAAYLHGSVRAAKPLVTKVRAMTPAWIAFLIFGLLGGLGLFLYGMDLAGDHLQLAAGEQMRTLIGKLARNRFSGVLLGTVASGVLQSSSAATVMLVGFVSASMMTLTQAISVTIGAKVGTTITVQLIAFNLSRYALLIIGAGAILIMAAGRREKLKHIGAILLGFGLLFFGLSVMSGSMKPLRGIPAFTNLLLTVGSSAALGILLGALFTAIVQSSAATVAICIALASQGLIPLQTAIPISIGAAVGTCATALLASLGANRDGKRVAVAHLVYSVACALIFLPLIGPFTELTQMFTGWMGSSSPARAIANGFMLFAIFSAVIFLPFVGLLERLIRWMIPTSEAEVPFGPKYINEAALGVPVMALEQAEKEVHHMTDLFGEQLRASIPAVLKGDQQEIKRLIEEDDKLDTLEKAIRPFLAKVARKGLSSEAADRERALIYITEHLEEAGDQLSKQVLHSGEKLASTKRSFSDEGAKELSTFHEKMVAKFDRVRRALVDGDRAAAEEVLQLSIKEGQLERRLRDSHLERLQSGTTETVKSSRDHLAILAGLTAVGGKLNDVADEILREM